MQPACGFLFWGTKLLGGWDGQANCAAFWLGQIRRRARTLERRKKKVRLPDLQSISCPGPQLAVFALPLQPACLFSPSLERPPLGRASTQVLPRFRGRKGVAGDVVATNTAARPTHNAARQAAEITKRLGLLRADALKPPILQPSSGD